MTIKTGMTIAELYDALPEAVNANDRLIPDTLYVEAKGVRITRIDPPRPEDGQYWVWAYYMLQSGLAEPSTPIHVRTGVYFETARA